MEADRTSTWDDVMEQSAEAGSADGSKDKPSEGDDDKDKGGSDEDADEGKGGDNKGDEKPDPEEPPEGDEGNRTEIITTNLGNKIDVTPSTNHTTTTTKPGITGTPDSSTDFLDEYGNIIQRRWYDSDGRVYRDVDMTNHGNPKTHPEYPHEHIWEWIDGKPYRY